jgi:hypothetical protein
MEAHSTVRRLGWSAPCDDSPADALWKLGAIVGVLLPGVGAVDGLTLGGRRVPGEGIAETVALVATDEDGVGRRLEGVGVCDTTDGVDCWLGRLEAASVGGTMGTGLGSKDRAVVVLGVGAWLGATVGAVVGCLDGRAVGVGVGLCVGL